MLLDEPLSALDLPGRCFMITYCSATRVQLVGEYLGDQFGYLAQVSPRL